MYCIHKCRHRDLQDKLIAGDFMNNSYSITRVNGVMLAGFESKQAFFISFAFQIFALFVKSWC